MMINPPRRRGGGHRDEPDRAGRSPPDTGGLRTSISGQRASQELVNGRFRRRSATTVVGACAAWLFHHRKPVPPVDCVSSYDVRAIGSTMTVCGYRFW